MWSFVPQLFYDFLARIVPGVILIASTVLVILGPVSGARLLVNPPQDANFYAVGPLGLLILLAYFCGFVLGDVCRKCFTRLFEERYRKVDAECKEKALHEHNAVLKAIGKSPLAMNVADMPDVPTMRDHIRERDLGNAARLLKVRAEKRLCETLALGFLTLGLLNLVYIVVYHDAIAQRLVLELLLLLACFACYRRSFRAHLHLAAGASHGWLFKVAPPF
jgi:hypothetical protein